MGSVLTTEFPRRRDPNESRSQNSNWTLSSQTRSFTWRFASREQHKMNAWLWTRRSCWSFRFARLDPRNSLYDAIFLVYFRVPSKEF